MRIGCSAGTDFLHAKQLRDDAHGHRLLVDIQPEEVNEFCSWEFASFLVGRRSREFLPQPDRWKDP